MSISREIEGLEEQLKVLPRLGHQVLTSGGGKMFMFDLIIIGALKRSLSLGHGLLSMIRSSNMTCARALLRMQIDTVSRIMAYTYVNDPEEMAREVILGKPLNKFKCRAGNQLKDVYLINRMTESHDWVREVYDRTSGEVHFSEKQFFASVGKIDDTARTLTLCISPFDKSYPESSWKEIASCCQDLNEILVELLKNYALQKSA